MKKTSIWNNSSDWINMIRSSHVPVKNYTKIFEISFLMLKELVQYFFFQVFWDFVPKNPYFFFLITHGEYLQLKYIWFERYL